MRVVLGMKGKNYRRVAGRPYSRKEYIHGAPPPKISKFTMGDPGVSYAYTASLIALANAQIRHNALEAARVAANKVLQDKLGEKGYYLKVNVYPHQVLREHKMMMGPHADRLSKGMKRAFGAPVATAARVENGQEIITIKVNEDAKDLVKEALRRGASKIPIPCRFELQRVSEVSLPA